MSAGSDPRTWAGYRAHTRARSTGTVAVLLDGIAAQLDTDGGRWQTICDEHDIVIAHTRQADARAFLHHPEEWCEECMAELPA